MQRKSRFVNASTNISLDKTTNIKLNSHGHTAVAASAVGPEKAGTETAQVHHLKLRRVSALKFYRSLLEKNFLCTAGTPMNTESEVCSQVEMMEKGKRHFQDE
jgi:hypothetical protein